MSGATKFCAHCSTPLERKRYNGTLESNNVFRRGKYCDLRCFGMNKRKTAPTKSALYKRAAKLRKPLCENCGTSSSLDLHHIDHNPSNNQPSNVMTLCSSCHTSWHWRHGKTVPRRGKKQARRGR